MAQEERDIWPTLVAGLYIVATPIGHLQDITLRALDVLRQVSVVAAEDTRTAGRLLQAHQLRKPLLSLHRDNEAQRTQQILSRLQDGETVALISEAGTPCISDPGYLLVKAAREADFHVIPIPGPSAVIAALSASGLPTQHFVFLGFLPTRDGRRLRMLAPYTHLPATLVLYESPHRILSLLDFLIECLGDREACLAREMTKRFEEFIRGPLSSIRQSLQERDAIKGEVVLMIKGVPHDLLDDTPDTEANDDTTSIPLQQRINNRAAELLASGKRPAKLARQLTTEFSSLSRNEAYNILEQLKESH